MKRIRMVGFFAKNSALGFLGLAEFSFSLKFDALL
jgi:hypothetical protein